MNLLSRLILLVLVVIAAVLYMRVILPPDEATTTVASTPEASPAAATQAAPDHRVIAKTGAAPTPTNASQNATGAPDDSRPLKPLPAEQMKLVIDTLAPELSRH